MLSRTVTTLAVLAIAGHAVADPAREPYQPELARMSTRNLFSLARRQDGYAPEQEICGSGSTCADACGKGFKQCASNDNLVHCYDSSAKQTCCPGNTGDSCDEGYFCSADQDGATWCCPDSMTLQECAKKYGLPGTLVSETASSASSTSAPSTTSTSDASSVSASVSTTAASSSIQISANCSTYTSTTVQSFIPTSSTINATSIRTTSSSTSASTPNTITSPATSTSPTSIITLTDTPPKTTASSSNGIATGAASSNGPASGLVLLLAGALAALF